uniref:Uncharacterized protein n=1 Tax=Oryza barthii TaxID=65489 RepID=A0A0D3H5T9_9ORYZ
MNKLNQLKPCHLPVAI